MIRLIAKVLWGAFRALSFLFVTTVALFYFLIPDIAYNRGGKEIISSLQPKWLLSDQPDILRIPKEQKNTLYMTQADMFIEMAYCNIVHFPSLVANYIFSKGDSELIGENYFGMSVDPEKNSIDDISKKLRELGVKSVLIRINYDRNLFVSPKYQKIKEAVNRLHSEGHEILLVLAQNRDSFEVGADLDGYFGRIFEDFKGKVGEYQIGETINRPKWGVIRKGEYEKFYGAAKKYRDALSPTAKLIAPSVIDFEWLYTTYFTKTIGDYDILNSLLYVDRVHQPENEQDGFDTMDKIALMRAVDTSKKFYITEFNWPLSKTGEYKPTSEKEAVSEELHAVYNIRYLLTTMASKKVDKVYYWQLYAKGYGLIDHVDMKDKPSFAAYKTIVALFKGAKTISYKKSANCYTLNSTKSGKSIEARWCKDESNAPLKKEPKYNYLDIYGNEFKGDVVSGSPVYIIEK